MKKITLMLIVLVSMMTANAQKNYIDILNNETWEQDKVIRAKHPTTGIYENKKYNSRWILIFKDDKVRSILEDNIKTDLRYIDDKGNSYNVSINNNTHYYFTDNPTGVWQKDKIGKKNSGKYLVIKIHDDTLLEKNKWRYRDHKSEDGTKKIMEFCKKAVIVYEILEISEDHFKVKRWLKKCDLKENFNTINTSTIYTFNKSK